MTCVAALLARALMEKAMKTGERVSAINKLSLSLRTLYVALDSEALGASRQGHMRAFQDTAT